MQDSDFEVPSFPKGHSWGHSFL
uniref:Uncharacterized protein n=1 Tax=Rhizophora mucronata TaxID=61149 RepID=A0A2P2NK39_RHIMU